MFHFIFDGFTVETKKFACYYLKIIFELNKKKVTYFKQSISSTTNHQMVMLASMEIIP